MKIGKRLTKEQKKNLGLLSDYLLSGNLVAEFYMGAFDDGDHPYPSEHHVCGSVGCAVGHGPYAGVPVGDVEGWYDYSSQKFVDSSSPIWNYLFATEWANYDNTPEGAGARIKFVLHNLKMKEKHLKDMIPWNKGMSNDC